jgi:hypothetical protein
MGLSVICMMGFLILNGHFSWMKLTLISEYMLTDKKTGTRVMKILMP